MVRIGKSTFPYARVGKQDFIDDPQGRKFTDVVNRNQKLFDQLIGFFDDEAVHQALVDSQVHHDRPPLAGVVVALEHEPWFDGHMRSTDAHETQRLRQAVGVLIKVIMLGYGFGTTGKKGSLGTRAKVRPGTTTPGAYHNTSGLSLWFGSAERYELPGNPYQSVEERAKSLP